MDSFEVKHKEAGERAVSVMKGLTALPDNGAHVRVKLSDALVAAGFDVRENVTTEYYGWKGERKRGFVDIVATHGAQRVAIELDARSPRYGSVVKLQDQDAYRIIGLRGRSVDEPFGVHKVIGLNVKPKTWTKTWTKA